MKVLFATSEAFPLVKTGGLADVSLSLPVALAAAGHDIKVVLPAYRQITEHFSASPLAELHIEGKDFRLLETTFPNTKVSVWLVDCPEYFQRPGDPYHDPQGDSWYDNARRFSFFCRVIAYLCSEQFDLFEPDILHCNDWQTGLAIPLAKLVRPELGSLFTIHNLAYQGLFSRDEFDQLNLPEHLWRPDSMEFYNQFCFIKGGIQHANRVNTVSPTYASEICTSPMGRGLEGLLLSRRHHLHGILNGIDADHWNPETDPLIVKNYSTEKLGDRARNTRMLMKELGLEYDPARPLIGFIGRMTEQKGIDMLIAAIEALAEKDVSFVILGTGEPHYQARLLELAEENPARVSVTIDYDEVMSHQIEASCDLFLMPSLFEPCGLNQMYSMRYGAIPVVSETGGLADTVIDADTKGGELPTGYVFKGSDPEACIEAIRRALAIFSNKRKWRKLQRNGMRKDFSWDKSAQTYQQLYEEILAD